MVRSRCALRDIPVDGRRGKPSGTQLFGDLLGRLLGAHEDDHRLELLDLEHPGQRVHLAAARHLNVALRNILGGSRFRFGRDFERIVQILGGDLADPRRHGRREQGHLLVFRGFGQDAVDFFGEAHGEHLVGLIEHQVVHTRQVQRAAIEVVDNTARSAHHDVRTASQPGQLHGVGGPAVDRQHVELLQISPVAAERLGHLQGQLPGGSQHQRLGGFAGGVDLGQDREREGRRLAGAGLRQPHHVRTRHQRRNRRRLDGRRRLVADGSDRPQDRRDESAGRRTSQGTLRGGCPGLSL